LLNCVVRHFSQDGVKLTSTTLGRAELLFADTVIADNGADGIDFAPGGGSGNVDALIDHVTIAHSGANAISLDATGVIATLSFAIENTTVSGSGGSGFFVNADTAATTTVSIDTSAATANGIGLDVVGASLVHLSNSFVSLNRIVGVDNETSGGGTLFSSDDNRINANPSISFGPTATPDPLR
jgi:hypothetical protein